MIQCPQCGQTIPASNQVCQFCKAPIPPHMRGPVPKTNFQHDDDSLEVGSGLPPEKVWKIYNGLAWFWIATAALSIIFSAVFVVQKPTSGLGAVVDIIFAMATLLIGVGLLAKNELARKAATFFCILSVVRGLLLVIGGMFSILIFGLLGVLFLIVYLFNLCLAAAMIWAVNETERLINWDRMNWRG